MTARFALPNSSKLTRLAAAIFVVATVLTIGGGSASASTRCGDYSFGFTGTRLLNDGISTSAGPFPITLPAGTYDVTLESFDDHAAHPGQDEQTAEQYYVTLDSGWVSPPSLDIPDAENRATTIHRAQTVPAASAISVHHLGQGGINSLEVLCVGFTPVEVLGETEPAPADPVAAEPVAPIDPLSLTRPVSESTPEKIDPLALERPPIPTDIEPEVEGIQEAPVLALTGPSTSATIALFGLSLLTVGAACLATSRRQQLVRP